MEQQGVSQVHQPQGLAAHRLGFFKLQAQPAIQRQLGHSVPRHAQLLQPRVFDRLQHQLCRGCAEAPGARVVAPWNCDGEEMRGAVHIAFADQGSRDMHGDGMRLPVMFGSSRLKQQRHVGGGWEVQVGGFGQMGIETVGIRMHEWIRCRTCLSSYESLTGFVWSQW